MIEVPPSMMPPTPEPTAEPMEEVVEEAAPAQEGGGGPGAAGSHGSVHRIPENQPPSAEKQPAPLDRLAELHPGDDLVEMLVARNKRIEDDEATKAAVHEEMSVRMDTGVRVNPALKRALLGEDGPGNGQADDWEVDDDEDEREDESTLWT